MKHVFQCTFQQNYVPTVQSLWHGPHPHRPIGRHSSTRFSREAAAGGYHGHASQVYGPLTMSPGISDETVTRFFAGCGSGMGWFNGGLIWFNGVQWWFNMVFNGVLLFFFDGIDIDIDTIANQSVMILGSV